MKVSLKELLTDILKNIQPDWNQTDSTKADYIKNKLKITSKSVTQSTAVSVSANGGTAWTQVPFPSSGTPIAIGGYYLDGGYGCSVYAMYLTATYASFAIRNGSSSTLSVKITCHYICI